MSAKPRFKPRVGWAEECKGRPKFVVVCGPTTHWKEGKTRVRVTDHRDPTPEKAVEKVLQQWAEGKKTAMVDLAASAGMSARIVNGKVRVRRVKQ